MGLARALQRNKDLSQEDQDRFEREKLEFHREVRNGYLELARKEDKRFVVINATLPMDDVEQDIFQSLSPILDEKRKEGVY
jgi:dTMP kinase